MGLTARRRTIRTWLAAGAIVGAGMLAATVGGHLRQRAVAVAAARVAPPDTWRVRGLRRHGNEDGLRFALHADEAQLERSRFGPFRIRVTRELYARGVRLFLAPVEQRPGRRPTRTGPGATGHGRSLTGLRVDDVAIRMRDDHGRSLKLRAERCDAGLRNAGLVTCRGRIRATDSAHAWSFDELQYEVGTGTVVSARGRSGTQGATRAFEDTLRSVAASRWIERLWPDAES